MLRSLLGWRKLFIILVNCILVSSFDCDNAYLGSKNITETLFLASCRGLQMKTYNFTEEFRCVIFNYQPRSPLQTNLQKEMKLLFDHQDQLDSKDVELDAIVETLDQNKEEHEGIVEQFEGYVQKLIIALVAVVAVLFVGIVALRCACGLDFSIPMRFGGRQGEGGNGGENDVNEGESLPVNP